MVCPRIIRVLIHISLHYLNYRLLFPFLPSIAEERGGVSDNERRLSDDWRLNEEKGSRDDKDNEGIFKVKG